jgi:phosphate starvation-inducible protein PhoH and related proteins
MKQPAKATRRVKATEGRVVKAAKPQWTEGYGLNKITLTAEQKRFSDKILLSDLVFCVGPAGTGKTLAALHTFVKMYLDDHSKRIIVIRTPVEAGMDKIGALPDGLMEKTEPHFASTKTLLEMLLNKGKVETDMDHRIQFKIPNFCLGATFDNSLILIDEAQQLPPLILKLLLERTGLNSKVVVMGDNTQLYVDAKGRNALLDALPRFFDKAMLPKYDGIEYHQFDVEDVQRSDLVKRVIRAYS